MNAILRPPGLAVVASLLSFSAQAVEANFQASFLVYGSPTSTATVAYEVPTGQNLSYYTDREVADDVTLSGTDRIIAGVRFEYYANYAKTAGLTFRMYEMTRSGKPGSMIYSLPLDILQGGGVVNIAFNYDSTNILPERFFYSVEFDSNRPSDLAGMMVPDREATTGSSSDQMYEKRGNAWLPIDFKEGRGRKLGFSRDDDRKKFRVHFSGEPKSRVKIQKLNNLNGDWEDAGEVDTDANGDAEFEEDTEGQDVVFFRSVEP